MSSEQGAQYFSPIIIRYDGLDAEKHEINLYEFGKSAQGLSKMISVIADFAVHGHFRERKRKLSCQVSVKEIRANCFSFTALIDVIDTIDRSPTMFTFTAITASHIFIGTFKYIWSLIGKPRQDIETENREMRALLQEVLKREAGGCSAEQLMADMKRAAPALIPAAKNAVSPIGETCKTIRFGEEGGSYYKMLDERDKAAINDEDFEVSEEQEYKVLISEFDMKEGSARISEQKDLKIRYTAKISDPQAELPNNKYVLAMSGKHIVTVKAKTKIVDGKIKEFIISDIK